MGKMGIQPSLPVKVPVKKIKGVARERYSDGDGVARCEQTLRSSAVLHVLFSDMFFTY